MLLRLRSHLDAEALEPVLRLAREYGLAPRFLDEERTLLRLDGTAEPGARSRFADLMPVKSVLEAGGAPELHEKRGEAETVVRVRGAAFGGGEVSIAAGPCAVENEERLLRIARYAKQAGAVLLRGGAYKPRTSPHSFRGLGADGLEMLRTAREETGLGIVTEVLDPRDVELVGGACDLFQVGARSMANAALLTELGKYGRPVLLKRGLAATVREFLLASEYLLNEGNSDVILCERGIRSFDTATRNLLDVGAIAHLKRATHLPVVVDPSHAAGRADLVRPLARAGIAAGADGVLVETHPEPHAALSDGAQAIDADELTRIVKDVAALVQLDGRRLLRPREERDSIPAS